MKDMHSSSIFINRWWQSLQQHWREVVTHALVYSFVINLFVVFPAPRAFAESEETRGCRQTGGQEDSRVECSVETHNQEGQDLFVGESYYSMIVLWSAAVVALFEIRRCITPGISCGWSTGFSVVGALALLAGEITSIAMYKESQDKIEFNFSQATKYKEKCDRGETPTEDDSFITDSKGNRVSVCDQLAALQAQKKAYEQAKTAAEVKMALQIGAAGAYAIAAGIEYAAAVAQNVQDSALVASCGTAVGSMGAAVSACNLGAAACEAQCAPCQAAVGASCGTIVGLISQWNDPSPRPNSAAVCRIIVTPAQTALRAVQTACGAAGVCAPIGTAFSSAFEARVQQLGCPAYTCCELGCDSGAGTTMSLPKKIDKKEHFFVEMVEKYFLSSAFAENPSVTNVNQIITKSLGLVGAAVAILLALFKAFDHLADSLYTTPLKRGLWNTAVALLAGGAAGMSAAVADKLKNNISQIDTILNSSAVVNRMRPTSPGQGQTIGYNEVTLDSSYFETTPIIPPNNPPLPCPAGGDGKGNCRNLSNNFATALGELDLQGVAGMAGQVATLGKELGNSRSISPGAMKSANAIAAASKKIKKFLNDAKNRYLLSRAKAKLPPLDLNKLEKAQIAKMYSTAKAVLAKNKMSPEALVGAAKPSVVSEQEKKKMLEDLKNEAKLSANKPAVATKDPLEMMALEMVENEGALAIAPGEINSGKEAEVAIDENLNIGSNDIHNNSNTNLFELVSQRYKRTAYPVLFEEIK